MEFHTIVVVGHSYVCIPQIQSSFSQQAAGNSIERAAIRYDRPLPYGAGLREAREMALGAAAVHRAPLCIGIMCVRYCFPDPSLTDALLDIAVVVQRGLIDKHETHLSSESCRRIALGRCYSEAMYTREATLTLLRLIKVRQTLLELT